MIKDGASKKSDKDKKGKKDEKVEKKDEINAGAGYTSQSEE